MRIPGMRGRRLESAEKAKKELGISLLAEIPQPSGGAERLEIAYTHLMQTVLLHATQGSSSRVTLAVTSTRDGEGRSSVAANLAIAAARMGRSVLLVDTESGDAAQHRIFGGEFAADHPGLLDLLAMTVTSPSEALQETTVSRLRLLPIGDRLTHDATALLSSPKLERFVRSIAPRLADVVIFDTPSVRSNEPGRHVLSHVDGVLFVVGLGETETSAAKKALDILKLHETPLLGGIFLTAGDFPRSQAVPLPEITLQKPEKDAEILGSNLVRTESFVPTETVPSTEIPTINEPDGKSMSVATQKQDEDQPSVPAGGFGVEDLEAVLQGWRRRDAGVGSRETSASAAASEAVSTEPIGLGIPLPPAFNIAGEEPIEVVSASPTPAGVAFPMGGFGGGEGVPIPIPFLSVATSEESADAELGESAEEARPILTIVEATEAVASGSVEVAPVVAVDEAPAEELPIEVVSVVEPVISEPEPVVIEPEPIVVEEVVVPEPAVSMAEPEREVVVPVSEKESIPMPVVPVFPVPVMAVETPTVVEPPVVPVAPVLPPIVTPVLVAEPVSAPEPEPVVIPMPVSPVAVPVSAAPVVEPIAPPVVPVAPPVVPPVAATIPVAAPVAAPAYTPMPTPAATFVPPAPVMPAAVATPPAPMVATAAPVASALDMQIDMFQTGPGEMTMRAATGNAPAVGLPPVSLELAMAMNAMRGMRAITPSSTGGPDQPRIALEAISTDAPDATRMRLVVGSTHEPALEVVVHNGAGISVRTGSGIEQPAVKLDSQNLPDGGTITRALLHTRLGQELTLELRREAVNDGFTDARWKNRLSLFG